MTIIEAINKEVEQLNEEATKFYDKKNKSAGTRVRKHAMNINKLTKELRKEVTEVKNSL